MCPGGYREFMVHGRRVLPEPTELTAAHWTSGASGRLLVQRCLQCRRWSFPPVPNCRHCWSGTLEFEPVGGKGALTSWAGVPGPRTHSRLVGIVDLVEGPRLMLGLVECDPDDLRVGAPVRLVFENVDDRIWLPMAELEESDLFEDRIEAVS